MFMGTRTILMGWGFQRRNTPGTLGFPECLQPHKRSPLAYRKRRLQIPASNISAGGTAGDLPAVSPGPHAAGRAGIQMMSW